MKATYRQNNKRSKSAIFTLAILASVLILLYGPVRSAISKALYSAVPSAWKVSLNIEDSWNSFWGGFSGLRELSMKNDALRSQVSSMELQILENASLKEEVLRLRKALGRESADVRVYARVLSLASQSPYDIIVVDVGTENGVKVGDRVTYSGAGVIGSISDVYSSSAKVKLFSSHGEENAVIIGVAGIPSFAYGRGMGNFEAKVPQGSNLAVGENVLLPGTNLIIGVIGSIEEKPALPFARVLFRTPFNISDMRSVEIVVADHVIK